MKLDLSKIEGFDWDNWNIHKIRDRHKVEFYECEEIFFNEDLLLLPDETHSVSENRYYALGGTDSERLLFVVFTIRRNKIRIISARNMSKKERGVYYEKTK
jgi:uncharacterized DUF497 family protein